MKWLNICLPVLIASALPARALWKDELDARVNNLASKFQILQQQPDKRIPAQVLARARGIVLLDRTRAGFLFAFQGGNGVAVARDAKTGAWGPAAFVKANQASLGFQIGAEENFVVILVMSTNTPNYLLTMSRYEFGGDARATAGNATTGSSKDLAGTQPALLVYTSRQGFYAGAAIKGGEISPDPQANEVYYGRPYTMDEILYQHKVPVSPAAAQLAAAINGYGATAKVAMDPIR